MSGYRLVVRQPGGPEAIEREEWSPAAPAAGELLIRHEAIGVNFIDIYHRTGLYPLPLPTGLGSEAAGVVEAVGEGVSDFAAGDRVAYFHPSRGGYATHGIAPAERVLPLPEGISTETAAASLLKGCTAEMLVERCAKLQAGQSVLIHAAAGGVGSLLVPWCKALGVTVIAHTGTPEKAALATAAGADHALYGSMDELAPAVRALTGGRGVDVVLDGVGAASWAASLASTARRGLIASYGNASGPVPPFSPLDLGRAGSLFLSRPSLFDYIVTPEELRASAARLFAMIEQGAVPVTIGARFPLADAADAHRALESRRTTGSVILEP